MQSVWSVAIRLLLKCHGVTVVLFQELCRKGGVLQLTLAVLKLQMPSSLQQSKSLVAFISRLKSKALSMVSLSSKCSRIMHARNTCCPITLENLRSLSGPGTSQSRNTHVPLFFQELLSISTESAHVTLCHFVEQLLKFCETDSVSFLDEVAADERSKLLAVHVAGEVSSIAKNGHSTIASF